MTKRAIRKSWTCVLFLFCLCLHGRNVGIQRKKTPFGTAVQVGMGLRRFENTCIWFQIFFVSDDFFSGLRSEHTRNGVEFTKKGLRYSNFPEDLVVDVQSLLHKCPIEPGRIEPPGYGEGLMSDVSFALKWKDQMQNLYPATLLSTKEEHRIPSLRWDYFLKVSARDVPLDDVLIVEVSLRRHTFSTQLSGSLNP